MIGSDFLRLFTKSDIKISCKDKLNEYINFCLVYDTKEKIKNKTEAHHILPKSLFTQYSNLRTNLWNIAHLSYDNHYKAHSILADALDSYKMLSAWNLMNDMNPKSKKDLKPEEILGAKKYKELREKAIKARTLYLTREFLDKDGNLTTIAKEAGKKVSRKINEEFLDEDGNITTIAKERGKRITATMLTEVMTEQGLQTLGMIRSIKSSVTMTNKSADKSITIAKQRALNSASKMKLEKLNENGVITCTYKESGIKGSETLNKEFLDKDGNLTTIAKERGKRVSNTRRKNGRLYDIYHIGLGLIKENVSEAEMRNISQVLYKKTKADYFGIKENTRIKLIKEYKSLLIGLYSKEAKN